MCLKFYFVPALLPIKPALIPGFNAACRKKKAIRCDFTILNINKLACLILVSIGMPLVRFEKEWLGLCLDSANDALNKQLFEPLKRSFGASCVLRPTVKGEKKGIRAHNARSNVVQSGNIRLIDHYRYSVLSNALSTNPGYF